MKIRRILLLIPLTLYCMQTQAATQEKIILKKLSSIRNVFNLSEEILGKAGRGTAYKSRIMYIYKEPEKRFTSNDGYCFITNIKGAWKGMAEQGFFIVDNNGWELHIKSGGPQIEVGGRCIMVF